MVSDLRKALEPSDQTESKLNLDLTVYIERHMVTQVKYTARMNLRHTHHIDSDLTARNAGEQTKGEPDWFT
jgi:hypothetical protein